MCCEQSSQGELGNGIHMVGCDINFADEAKRVDESSEKTAHWVFRHNMQAVRVFFLEKTEFTQSQTKLLVEK